jgi:amidohydrolase
VSISKLTRGGFAAKVEGMGASLESELIDLGRRLAEAAEPGFFEHRTQAILAERFRARGFQVREFPGMTGFLAAVDGSPPSPPLAVVADMDALPMPGALGSPGAYAHTCGHHLQMTALFGAACLLAERHPELAPLVAFLATPAEEYVELERREALRREGRLRALSGKQELLERGAFAGFRAVVATHAAVLQPGEVSSVLAMNGFEVRRWSFLGASAHAGAHPHRGRNAQNAGALFLQACAFLRETFPEDRHVRIHPVLRLPPGQAVNLIPEAALVETYVRAVDPETVQDTARRLQAAAEGCAAAIGVELHTEVLRGYAPFRADARLQSLLRETVEARGLSFVEEPFSAASSDMGDVSRQKPSIIIGLPGTNGRLHEPEFRVTDERAAYAQSAELLADYLRRLASLPAASPAK